VAGCRCRRHELEPYWLECTVFLCVIFFFKLISVDLLYLEVWINRHYNSFLDPSKSLFLLYFKAMMR